MLIGLIQGSIQSMQLAMLLVGGGLALLWLGMVVVKPEAALLLYTVLAVNLNSVELPLPVGGLRLSPDILLISLLIVGVLLRVLTTRSDIGTLPISLPYLIFLAVPVITLLWSPTEVESLRGIFRFVGYYALMWLIVDAIRTRQQVRHMVVALIISLVIPIATGFYQAVTGGGQVIWAGALLNRIYGFAGGPVHPGVLSGDGHAVAVDLLSWSSETERAPIFEPSGGSRGSGDPGWQSGVSAASGWACCWGCIGGTGADFYPRRLVRSGGFVARAGPGARLAAVSPIGLYHPRCRRCGLVDLLAGPRTAAEVADPTSTFFGRVEVWKLAWDWIASSPLALLAGVGMKAFEYYYILMAGPTTAGLYWRRESFLVGNRPHNELLGFMLDVGLIGTVALIAVLFILVRLAVRVYRRSSGSSLRLVALAFAIGFVGLVVGAMGDNVFSQPVWRSISGSWPGWSWLSTATCCPIQGAGARGRAGGAWPRPALGVRR